MAVRTLQEQLDALDALIANIEAAGGTAEYQHGVERYRYQDLDKLYTRRDLLQNRVNQEACGTFALLDPFNS